MSTKIWKKKKRSLLEECGSETGKERGEARRLLSKWHLNSWKDGIVWFLQHETIGTCVLEDFDSVCWNLFKVTIIVLWNAKYWRGFQVSFACAVAFFRCRTQSSESSGCKICLQKSMGIFSVDVFLKFSLNIR